MVSFAELLAQVVGNLPPPYLERLSYLGLIGLYVRPLVHSGLRSQKCCLYQAGDVIDECGTVGSRGQSSQEVNYTHTRLSF